MRLLEGLRKIRSEGYNSTVYLWTIGTMEILLATVYLFGGNPYLMSALSWLPVGYVLCLIGTILLISGVFSLCVESRRLDRYLGKYKLKPIAFALNTMALTATSVAYLIASFDMVGHLALAGAVVFAYLAFKSFLASGWPDTPAVKVDQEVIERMKAGR